MLRTSDKSIYSAFTKEAAFGVNFKLLWSIANGTCAYGHLWYFTFNFLLNWCQARSVSLYT